MANETFFENVGRLFFTRRSVRELEGKVNAAGIDMPADAFAGYIALNVIVVSLLLTLLLVLYGPAADFLTGVVEGILIIELPLAVIGVALFIILIAVIYASSRVLLSTYLLLKTENRRNLLEMTLPDFLMLVASNIKAGMTLDQAMWYAAKPEFGLLSQEVKRSVKSSFSGESMEDSLDNLASRFDSRIFTRTILLLKQASASGGELTDVLESTAEDVRNTLIMKKEIAASLVLYEIFVLFAAVVGTPFLFAVSHKLIEVFERLYPYMPTTEAGFGYLAGISFAGPQIGSAEFFFFTIPVIFITALISSFIISAIRTGSKGQGLKYFPFVLVASLLVYWFVSTSLASFFSSFA